MIENIRDNLYSPLNLAILCATRKIHFTYLGTGCIFKYDSDIHKRGNNNGCKEEDLPNFFGSSYSVVKGFTDRLMKQYENTALNLRIRMPITDDDSTRNFITKITSYKKICSIDNSMTVLPELIPIMIQMIVKLQTGTINMTNPNTITHNRILELYKDIVDPSFKWENFNEEEQRKILLSDRSNNYLDTTKLEKFHPDVLPIEKSVIDILHKMKLNRLNKSHIET